MTVTGSSPLTRGKRHPRIRLGLPTGLIPAHAGKTHTATRSQTSIPAHPRSRGENVGASRPPCVIQGSSPLTRGKQASRTAASISPGLIPAHAGKTPWWHLHWRGCRAHPRSRGENLPAMSTFPSASGSSPLTRGKPLVRTQCLARMGLIPAHAGKTSSASAASKASRAHPRSRGENAAEETAVDIHLGSSPLTRGKLPSRRNDASQDGLIPAHAGKTRLATKRAARSTAHPRSRGENPSNPSAKFLIPGSSPLTRGKRCVLTSCVGRVGLIPAHAGKTPTSPAGTPA